MTLFLIASVWLFTRTGVVELPGGMVVDVAIAKHALMGAEIKAMTGDAIQGRLKLPPGFAVQEWATGIPNARMLYVTQAGDLLVTSPRSGEIRLIERDANRDGSPDGIRLLLKGLDRPHGLDWHNGWLYIGEGDAISRVRFDPKDRLITGSPERIISDLPNGGNHWTKTVRVGPDDKLYVSIGSSCNVCEEEDVRRATMMRFELDGSKGEIVASGLRNSVDFDWHPETGQLFATDNGRDLLGDDFPPCEINFIEEGGFYGWPYANAPNLPDPDFGGRDPEKVALTTPPVHNLPAHTAPLGIAFYDGGSFPSEYQNAAFVALHGSWNRREKQGYEVLAVHLNEDGTSTADPFLTGFQIGDDVSGRPVSVAVGKSGELFVSDDYTGTIYRVTYGSTPLASTFRSHVGSGDKAALVESAPVSELAMSSGRDLWRKFSCESCHVEGNAVTPIKPLASLSKRYDVASLSQFLRVPQPPMPVFEMTDAERKDLSSYLLNRFN